MKVVCAPEASAPQSTSELCLAMMHAPADASMGTVGRRFREAVRKAGVSPSPVAWDFSIIALAAVAADHACLRKLSPDGWTREIDLHVALVNPSVWEPHLDNLTEALQFLTGDLWTISLSDGGLPPLHYIRKVNRPRITGDCVSLLSGGIDSLVGAIDLVSAGRAPVFVSQVAKGDADKQRSFASSINSDLDHVQLSHTTRVAGTAELSQRARSIFFLALGGLVGSSIQEGTTDKCSLMVPENGLISYNVPLTPFRVGSLSTRTTHPHFLRLIQDLWDSVGLEMEIRNPYQHRTKGEMLANCASQDLLVSLAYSSTSCGRFGRFGYKHCGRCFPCLIRRAAFLAWGKPDQTEYVYGNLHSQSNFDDVRAAAVACLDAKSKGVLRWSKNALSSRYVDDVDAAVDLVERGFAELRALLRATGVL